MAKKTITIEAESLEEAREQARSQMPTGYTVLSEEVVSDGRPKTTRVTANTIEEAKRKAMDQIADGVKVLSTKEVAPPEQVTVSVEAYDEPEARRKLEELKGESATIQGLRLIALGKKGFLGIGRTPNQYTLDVFIPACAEIEYQEKAVISVTLGDESELVSKIIGLAETYAGGWPVELPRDSFNEVNFDWLLFRLRNYQQMAHPSSSFSFFSPLREPTKPEYKMVGGKIGRVSDLSEDLKLVTTSRLLRGQPVNILDSEQIGRLAFQVIEHYAQTRLARFLFLLPKACDDVAKLSKGAKTIVVAEHDFIEVFKGVENLLFEIYDELNQGGTFDDTTVTRKLLTLVPSARRKENQQQASTLRTCPKCFASLGSEPQTACPKCGAPIELGAYVAQLRTTEDDRINSLLQRFQDPFAFKRESAIEEVASSRLNDQRIIDALEILASSDHNDSIRRIARRTLDALMPSSGDSTEGKGKGT